MLFGRGGGFPQEGLDREVFVNRRLLGDFIIVLKVIEHALA